MSDGTPIIIVKKKVHGGHGHHGGSWKVAYADFVTAMMAFFMVMWIMGLSDQTKAQIAGYFNDPLGFKKNESRSFKVVSPKNPPPSSAEHKKGSGEGAAGTAQKKDEDKMKQLKQKLQDELENDPSLRKALKGVEMTIDQEGLRIEIVETKDAAFFKSGSAELNPIAYSFLTRIAPVLRASDRSLILEGHTDSVPYASQTYTNWDLSSDRANELRRQLFKDGINPGQLKGVRALADTHLKYPADPTNEKNRRVTILLPFQSLTTEATKLPKDDLTGRPPDIALAPELAKK